MVNRTRPALVNSASANLGLIPEDMDRRLAGYHKSFMPTISSTDLTLLVDAILQGGSVPPHKAKVVATSLVAANLRGVDTHGVQLLPFYIDQLLAGEMDPLTDGEVVSEQGACLLFDGHNGLGQWVAEICCQHAVRIAGELGMAFVTARDNRSRDGQALPKA